MTQTTPPTEVQVRELDEVVAPPQAEQPRRAFVPRRSAGPVRQSDLIDVDEGDVDLTQVDKVDALEELLALDPDRVIEQEVDMSPELKGTWVVQALSNELNVRLIEQATYFRENPRTHDQVRQMDNIEFTRLVVAHCVKKPNLLDPRLFQKHRISPRHPDQLIAKILLPGQIERLAGVIMRLSAYRDDLVEVAKNLSKRED